jgi:hypothetical protein
MIMFPHIRPLTLLQHGHVSLEKAQNLVWLVIVVPLYVLIWHLQSLEY